MLKIGASALPLSSLRNRNAILNLKSSKIHTKLICSSSEEAQKQKPRNLILYSKPGCCLCDGLKEKLNAAFSLSSSLQNNVELEIRDITTNPEWERAYQYEIPVLAILRPDGTQETLPRLSPRLGVGLIQRKIADAFKE